MYVCKPSNILPLQLNVFHNFKYACYVINFKKILLIYIITFDTVINFMQNIMSYKQIRTANAQRDSEKYRLLKEEILDK